MVRCGIDFEIQCYLFFTLIMVESSGTVICCNTSIQRVIYVFYIRDRLRFKTDWTDRRTELLDWYIHLKHAFLLLLKWEIHCWHLFETISIASAVICFSDIWLEACRTSSGTRSGANRSTDLSSPWITACYLNPPTWSFLVAATVTASQCIAAPCCAVLPSSLIPPPQHPHAGSASMVPSRGLPSIPCKCLRWEETEPDTKPAQFC